MADITRLTAQTAAGLVQPLAALLIDAVQDGASVGFLPPLAPPAADEYWHGVLDALGSGSRILWVAADGDGIAGSVQLDLCMRANGLHRAEVSKLIVHTRARRRGLGRALMLALEAAAIADGRTTLVLDTRLGDPSEALYQSLGYVKSGEVPRYACSADGHLHATAFYYKLL